MSLGTQEELKVCQLLLAVAIISYQALCSIFSMHYQEGIIFVLILKTRKLSCMQLGNLPQATH